MFQRRLQFCSIFAIAMTQVTASRSAPVGAIGTWIEIQRAAESQMCPDADSVFRAIFRLFPEQPVRRSMDSTQSLASATVKIRRTSRGHEAFVRITQPREGERFILDESCDCDGLADALAVTIVMLLDPATSDATPPSPSSTSTTSDGSPQPAAVATPQQTQKSSEPRQVRRERLSPNRAPNSPATARHHSLHALVSGGAIAGLGLLSKPSLGVDVGLGLFHQSGFGFRAQGVRLWALPAERSPGRIEFSLWGLLTGPCYRQRLSSQSFVDACLLIGAGAQHVEAVGYARSYPKTRSWWVAGATWDYGLRFNGWLIGHASAGALGHLRRYSFQVEDLGEVTNSPTIGGVFGLSLEAELRSF